MKPLYMFAVMGLISIFSGVAKADAGFTCLSEPGAQICGMIADVAVDEATGCNSQASCSAIWASTANDDAALVQAIEANIPVTAAVALDLGTKAQALAKSICSDSWTGLNSDGYNAVAAQNKLLPHLSDLQTAAGIKDVTTCELDIN